MSVIFTCQVHQSILCLTINTSITVWKFEDFSTVPSVFLRENNLYVSRVSSLNFGYEKLQSSNIANLFQNKKIKTYEMVQWSF